MATGSSSSSDRSTSGNLQCVGRLEIVRPKPVGFLCGSLPVSTDKAFHHNAFNSSALVPSSSQTVKAPRYRELPRETDLNNPPLVPDLHDKVLPISAIDAPNTSGDLRWDGDIISQNLTRKCETLAVSGLAEYGDEIDVVAPVDILKQIFKMPYSKARLSVAVHRIGRTLVMNTGPDIEEGEKFVRRHSSKSECGDDSLFLNFAMHSVRAEACDLPRTHYAASEEQSNSSIFPGHYESAEGSFVSCNSSKQSDTSSFLGQRGGGSRKEEINHRTEYPHVSHDGFWDRTQNNRSNRRDAVKKTSQVGEKSRCSVHESEKYRRAANDSFMRVLFWQFHNFRMLLGSDLLLFSNEKYTAVSLHLWDVTRQVTPLTWLEAWLDNIMASVPELAICYHENGVVQGYELLKTDNILLLKGISEDGTPAFHPQVVQQNGLSVLRFLQENCKQDPGAYWLYKNAGEDVIQLFDLSVIPKSHSSEDDESGAIHLPSLMHRGRRDSLFSLGTLLYRLAHRLSLSMAPNNRAKCARLFKKCFDFLDEQDHLVVRALAHEQFARLILKCYEEIDFTSEFALPGSEVSVTDIEDESSDFSMDMTGSVLHNKSSCEVTEDVPSEKGEIFVQGTISGVEPMLEACVSTPRNFLAPGGTEVQDSKGSLSSSSSEDNLEVLQKLETAIPVINTVSDLIPSKLAAIHHVSQAIKSLRWKRQLQNSEDLVDNWNKIQERSSPVHLSVCACGDADCIEVCNIREWLPKSKMDHKLWKLVLLLGESYLALGEAYKEDAQLREALKVVDLACSVYGSVPQHLEDAKFISSMISSSSTQSNFNDDRKASLFRDGMAKPGLGSRQDCFTVDQFSSTYLFWAKAWTLVGDVHIEYQMISIEEKKLQSERKSCSNELKISSEVEKEVKRLKKKLGQFKMNCSTCSLINCSCQSDRASSGNSASSSSGDMRQLSHGRKHSKRSNSKKLLNSKFGILEDDHCRLHVENVNDDAIGYMNRKEDTKILDSPISMDKIGEMRSEDSLMQNEAMPSSKVTSKGKVGGIFKYLEGPKIGDVEYNLSAAISCYDEANKALSGIHTGAPELHSVVKKKGWVCNELGRYWLGRKDLDKAEVAFADAITAFKKVSDHTNIILINCNLGHGRRALAEEMVSKMDHKAHALLRNAYHKALETAKLEYSESLRYYGAAKSELYASEEDVSLVTTSSNLKNEVYTQLAHTYLRLGMLLAKEDISAEVYETGSREDLSIDYINSCDKRARREMKKHEISANDAIREALSIYESLGKDRRQEAAYANFQLACYHRDCCLKFLHQMEISRSESGNVQKVKQYASLAEKNWQKSINFYSPNTHPVMYLTVVIEQSALLWKLSESLHSHTMLESALSRLLEGRHVVGEQTADGPSISNDEVDTKFRSQLQALLKRMLQKALSGSTSKSSTHQEIQTNNKCVDAAKLRELYGMSLKLSDLSKLHAMYKLWMS